MKTFTPFKKNLHKNLFISGRIFLLLISVFILAQIVLAQDEMESSRYKIKGPSLEIQKTDFSQTLSLVKREGDKEEVAGEAKIVDPYLISDIPENEFLDEYFYLKSSFQDLSISVEADQPIFYKEDFYHPLSSLDKAELKLKSFLGIKTQTLAEYRLIKEIDKSRSLQTNLNLSKISLTTHYQELDTQYQELDAQFLFSVKQAIILTNNSSQDLNLSLLLKNKIDTDKILWSDNEYFISENPQRFGNPAKISFYSKDEEHLSFYDYSDISEEFGPELWVEKQDSQNFFILSLNIFIPAHSSKTIDSTYSIKITILNTHSHPQAGDYWTVSFITEGRADLTITPDDQPSIDDLDFISLTCDQEQRIPQILEGDVIFYPDWSCEGTGEVTHLVNVAREHTLKFQFGDKIAYAYNSPDETSYNFLDCDWETPGQDCWAYECGTATAPSNPDDYVSEATEADYINLKNEEERWETAQAVNDGEHDSQIYTFEIDESTSSISQIYIEWDGYGETQSGYSTLLRIWDDNASGWTTLDTIDYTAAEDRTASGTISSNLHYYINASSHLSVLGNTRKYAIACGGIEWDGHCWYEGGADQECEGVCEEHGGNEGTCQENDSDKCELAELFHPGEVKECLESAEIFAPYYGGDLNGYFRVEVEGDCRERPGEGNFRFCACNE